MRNVMVLATAILLAIGLALPAAAAHTHVRLLGNGQCVILAQNGGEKYVDLPGERTHPLHSNVHKGEPGERGTIGVLNVSDGFCGGSYVND